MVDRCTGERYPGQLQQYAAFRGWHGKFGHLNVLCLDHEDICTHFGRHDRVVTTLPQFDDEVGTITLYVRVDHVWKLGMPSERDILDIIRKHDGTKGRWRIQLVRQWDDLSSTDIWFVRPG